jgi:hypothetical protein
MVFTEKQMVNRMYDILRDNGRLITKSNQRYSLEYDGKQVDLYIETKGDSNKLFLFSIFFKGPEKGLLFINLGHGESLDYPFTGINEMDTIFLR